MNDQDLARTRTYALEMRYRRNVATGSRSVPTTAAAMQAVGLSFKAEATMYNE